MTNDEISALARAISSQLDLPKHDAIAFKETDAAKYLGISLTGCESARQQGLIKGKKVNRLVFYSKADLHRLVTPE